MIFTKEIQLLATSINTNSSSKPYYKKSAKYLDMENNI